MPMQPAKPDQKIGKQPKLAKSAIIRWLCIILAWACIIIGTIGIVVPGLPTIDFYILAGIFAAKGSQRLHFWIYHNRFIGPILQQWHEHRSIPKKAKYISLISMSIAAGIMIWKVPHPWFVGITIGCMVLVQVWLWLKVPDKVG
ncbi:hypothetical protein SAMN05421731_104196 [Acinetobacter puyangensis]|uniref:Inner membrane protein n=2 Tax=Acinetobacter puyangensis TaxID=1096779 RepID=A0A240E7X1_9GAMM|nr:YbaN family protein [Acinetobacter puyangensis]SNX44837.1 hypothetical protein SAMN05421731_104196 [Acinetobacter puyangensis]